ncbi:MAG: hypothetical protein OEW08_14420 [Gammaproteobacteria bacterium]|nr:hypothetical protein [Gammaproteobacteria bacterium]
MIRSRVFVVAKRVGFCTLLAWCSAVSFADDDSREVLKWRAVGIITGQAVPFTTDAYFPRPLVAGELVEMIFAIDPTVPGMITDANSNASYFGAVKSVKVSGSDWSVRVRKALGQGYIAVSNDNPNYGDALAVIVNSVPNLRMTWYDVQVSLRNPGGPSPGAGPWAPFDSVALPRVPPALGYFPSNDFYLGARRDVPGQALDGGAYYGKILSLDAVKSDDE